MASFFNLTLDTTAPSLSSVSCAEVTNNRNISLTLSAEGASQMKIWGDIQGYATGGNIYNTLSEDQASWETYATSKTVTLSQDEGAKTIYVKFRDAVGNETAAVSCTTNLDTLAPVVTITGPDVGTISKIDGYDECSFSFSASEAFVEYSVRIVPSSSSNHTAGTQIPTTNGSTNMGGAQNVAASTPVSCKIKGADLEAASSGDGAKIVKVFVKDALGNWSV